MILFSFLQRVDVFTENGILFFYTGISFPGWKPNMHVLSYKDAFPHSCEINNGDNRGVIDFENIPPKGLGMIEWPEVIAREELIFRRHCMSYRN